MAFSRHEFECIDKEYDTTICVLIELHVFNILNVLQTVVDVVDTERVVQKSFYSLNATATAAGGYIQYSPLDYT